jgi:hypothetical protein
MADTADKTIDDASTMSGLAPGPLRPPSAKMRLSRLHAMERVMGHVASGRPSGHTVRVAGRNPFRWVALAAVAISVAACSSAAAPTPQIVYVTPAPTAAASPAATPTLRPTATPVPTPVPASSLEALLPSTYNGTTLQRYSWSGTVFVFQNPTSFFSKMVTTLGLTAADLSGAAASDPAGTTGFPSFVALRFAGVDGSRLLQVLPAAMQESGLSVETVTIGGKDVMKVEYSDSTAYYYVRDDVVLGVTAKDAAVAAEALSTAMPASTEPTPTPAPTMTTDDLKIDGIVKDGIAAWLKLGGELSTAGTDADVLRIFEQLKSLADTQLLLTNIYTASPCTQEAWTLYMKGMGQVSSGSDAVITYINDGAVGAMPSEEFVAAGATFAGATKALQAPTC